MNGQGLAQAGAQPAMDGDQQQDQQRQMIDQVKQALLKGATPEDLLAQGVPKEIIVQAIKELQAEIAQQQQAQQQAQAPNQAPMPQQGQGLAARGMQA